MKRQNNRVVGHGLMHEGWAYAPSRITGLYLRTTLSSSSGPGHAKCECGIVSRELPNCAQRKAWHRKHKMDISSSQS